MIIPIQKVNAVSITQNKKNKINTSIEIAQKKNVLLDSSCPTNRCSSGGQCSTRLDGNYHCECFLGYDGPNCENGFFLFFFLFFFWNS